MKNKGKLQLASFYVTKLITLGLKKPLNYIEMILRYLYDILIQFVKSPPLV